MQRVGTHFRGFTIVELLIVIVVIATLAAITLVAYNGIRERAQVSAVQSAVSQGGKKRFWRMPR
ncbi:prepilin-type N-terminal cleavage/methylation domain-containing protein [Candidatus Saccharibacteria bacterium]|nr:prepilin-type N-terminal cleavage/methylation domain-containing protein [Candidatus Saccharibacteria bacterium]